MPAEVAVDDGSNRARRLAGGHGRGWREAAAAGAFVLCAALVLASDPWDPLADWGWPILLAACFALGLISARWRVLLAALALLPLGALNRAPEPGLFLFLVPLLALVACAAIAAGIGVHRLIARRRADAPRTAGLSILCIALTLLAAGVYLDQRVVDRRPSSPQLVDERSGSLRGIAAGQPIAQVLVRLGPPVVGSADVAPSPLGVGADLSGPSSMPAGWQTWRYRDIAVLHSRGKVRGYLTTDPRAQTAAGVGVGDSLAIARRAYSNLDCSGVSIGSDSSNPSYLACVGRLRSGDAIWFGGDPIDSIWVLRDSDLLHAGTGPLRRRP